MKVIVALDESPYSNNVIEAVLHKKWPKDTQLKLLTVLEPICCEEDTGPESASLICELRDRRKKACARLCERVRHRIEYALPEVVVHTEIREGLPRTEIVNAAVEWSSDKILIGAHGKDVCPHNLLGSVSRSVASQAPCSIEIIRAKSHRNQDPMTPAAKSTSAN